MKATFPRTTYDAENGAASLVNMTKKRFEVRFTTVLKPSEIRHRYMQHTAVTEHRKTLRGKLFDKQRTVA